MILPFVDRSPLINSLRTRTNAEVSGISFDKMRLQQKQNTINSVLGLASAGLQLGEAVYNIFEEKKLEEAKKLVNDEDREIQKLIQTGIYDGTIKVTATDDGQTFIDMPEDLTERMSNFESELENKFKGFGKVRNWAKDRSRQSYDNAQSWAYKVAFEKGMKDRNEVFSRNLESAYNDSVQTGDPSIYENQIDSADWLSSEKKEYLKSLNAEKYKYDMYEKDVIKDVDLGDLKTAIKKADNFPGKDEDKRILKKKALLRKEEMQNIYNEEFKAYYTEGKENGRTAQDIIESLENRDVPEDYKKAAIEEVRKHQKIDGIKYGNKRFNEVRDNPLEIRKAYLDIKSGASSLEYDGIPITHKAILDMFEKRISEFEKERSGDSKKEIDFDNEMYAVLQSHKDGLSTAAESVNYIRSLETAGGSAKTAEKIENEIFSGEKAEYKPFFKTIDNFESQIKDKDYEAKKLCFEIKDSLYKLSANGASYKEMQEATDNALGIMASKYADYIFKIVDQGGMKEGEFNTSDKQHFRLYEELTSGEADELISMDPRTKKLIFRGGVDKFLTQMIEKEQNYLESLGYKVTQGWEKQGKGDVKAWPIYEDIKSGKTIKFFPDEKKKEVVPKYYDSKTKKWIPLLDEESEEKMKSVPDSVKKFGDSWGMF